MKDKTKRRTKKKMNLKLTLTSTKYFFIQINTVDLET